MTPPRFGMAPETILRALLQRDDLRRGVKADVEVALHEVEALREEVERLRANHNRDVTNTSRPPGTNRPTEASG